MEVTPLFFLECIYISLLYLSFAFDFLYVFWLCVCVYVWEYVCVGVVSDFTDSYFLCVRECMSWDLFVVEWFEI